jgi:two-component sensor histidine kinase
MSVSTKRSDSDFGNGSDAMLRRENERLKTDIERLRERLDAQNADFSELKSHFARYETALRGSKVTVFTQDRDLRYTSISNPFCGRTVERILGCTDDELFPGRSGAAMVALKRAALDRGQPARGEVLVEDFAIEYWFDLHIEPLRNPAGVLGGVACAAVNISKRKEDEAHLRLLLRELTHRSKNLLAVIQAMARQTARHAGSMDGFLSQFSGRLQSLAAAHDLLVRGSWRGASMRELIQAQLAAYIDDEGQRVSMSGPSIALKPEAAQTLGLALHELAANAARFGAFSADAGRVAIAWERMQSPRDEALVLDWREEGGPPVKVRRKRGFGAAAIERNLALALEADVSLDFDPAGVHCRIVIPAVHLLDRPENASAGRP